MLSLRLVSPIASSDAALRPSSSCLICGSWCSSMYLESTSTILSRAAVRKWPEPIAMSAQRNSKKALAAASGPSDSSRASSRSVWLSKAGTRAWSIR